MEHEPATDSIRGFRWSKLQQGTVLRHSSPGDGHLRRLLVILVVLFVPLGAAIVGGHLHNRVVEHPVNSPWSNGVPTVAAADALSTSWYCAGPTGVSRNGALQIVIANTENKVVFGTVEVTSEKSSAVTRQLSVNPLSDLVINPSSFLKGNYLGSVVTLNGGGIGVAELLGSTDGVIETPCSSITSPNWYFPFGSTISGNNTTLILFDPTHESAVAAVSMSSDQHSYSSQTLQSISIKSMGVVALKLGRPLPSLRRVALDITTHSGRLVAFELERRNTSGVQSTTLTLGASSPASRWYFPLISPAKGVSDVLYVYNPSGVPAHIGVVFHGSANKVSAYRLHMLALPNRLSTLQLDLSALPRAIGSEPFALRVESTGGVPIVVGRAAIATAPSPYSGYAVELGSLEPITRSLLIAVPPSSGSIASWLDLYEPASVASGRSSGR